MFPSVFGHSPIKITKVWLFQAPLEPWSDSDTVEFWWSSVPLFVWCCGQACYCFPAKLKSQVSTLQQHVENHIGLQGHFVLAGVSGHVYFVHSQSTSSFVGLESRTRSNFVIRNHSVAAVPGTTDFVFCKSDVLFLHHQDTVLLKFGLQDTLSFKVLQKMCNTVTKLSMVVHHLWPKCLARFFCSLQGQGHSEGLHTQIWLLLPYLQNCWSFFFFFFLSVKFNGTSSKARVSCV